MEVLEYCDDISKTQDDFVIVTLKLNTRFNEPSSQRIRQFAGNVFLNIRDVKNTDSYQSSLAFDVKGFLPLPTFLNKHVFHEKELQKICLQAVNLVLQLKDAQISPANLIWNMEYIYVNDITSDMRFIFLPIETSIAPEVSVASLHELIKKILFAVQTERYYEIQGRILSLVNNSGGFDPARFAHELKMQEIKWILKRRLRPR